MASNRKQPKSASLFKDHRIALTKVHLFKEFPMSWLKKFPSWYISSQASDMLVFALLEIYYKTHTTLPNSPEAGCYTILGNRQINFL